MRWTPLTAPRRTATVTTVNDTWTVAPARALYQRLGYVEIEPYTRDRYAEHWYGKEL
jgi:hypothetical protein